MDLERRTPKEIPVPPLVLEVLIALSRGPAHGYAILKEIERQSNGGVRPGTSSLYAALKTMEERGLVADAPRRPDEESGGPPRKYFRITELGMRVGRLEARRLARAADRAGAVFGGSTVGEG